MPTLADIGGAEPSTITFRVATVTQNVNGTVVHKEVLVLGDPDTTNAIAAVLNTTPASTAWGLVTRPMGTQTIQGNSTVVIVSGNSSVFQASSAWQVQVTNQTRVTNSSAADFLATISGNSTVAPLAGSVWSIQGNSTVVIVSGNSSVFQASSAWQVQVTNQARVTNSSAADFLVTVSGNSTVAPLAGSVWSIQGNSTVAPLAGSTWNTRPLQSSAADLQMTATPAAGSTWNVRALNSSAADLQMTATPVSGSTWNTRPIQSSAADLQMTATPASGSTWNTRTFCSSRADFLATIYQSSATELKCSAWQFDGIGNAVESSTRAVGTNSTMRGMAVRQIMPSLLSKASSNAFTSSAFTIATSNAATLGYVYAYSITTTNQTPTKVAFYAGSTLAWPVVLAAISSAVSGVNLAVSPPAYLFAGTTGGALTLNIPSSGAGWKVGVSYWTE